jgi:hypothetical protein
MVFPVRRTVAAAAGLLVTAALSACAPIEETGFVLDPATVTCFVDGASGLSVLQIPLVVEPSMTFEPDILRVEFDSPKNVSLAGIGMAETAAGYEAREPLPSEALEALVAQRDDTMLYLPVDRSGSEMLVVLLERSKSGAGTIDSFRLFWGGGEPTYWQVLDVSAVIDESCVVTPN